MLDVIESLMNGQTIYPNAFVTARPFWQNFYAQHQRKSDADLQRAIESAQLPFQWEVEKVGLEAPYAKSIMALTAIAALYNDGFEDEVLPRRVLRAFINSKSLSTGVIGAAKEVARLYRLE